MEPTNKDRQPKRDDWVLVRDDETKGWYKRRYCATTPDGLFVAFYGNHKRIGMPDNYFEGYFRKYMKEYKPEELTRQEIADKFKIPVEQLIIKD